MSHPSMPTPADYSCAAELEKLAVKYSSELFYKSMERALKVMKEKNPNLDQPPTPKRVYLSGPMTGIEKLNFPAFNAAASRLRAQGADVVNPAEIEKQNPGEWKACLRADIKELCDCTTIAMIPGWENSNGAHLELHIAHRLGLEIIFL